MMNRRPVLWILLLLLTSATAAAPAAAPVSVPLQGHWEGAIDLPGSKLEVNCDFLLKDGAWTGDISIPAQGARDLPLGAITLADRTASFAIQGIPGAPVFKGTLSEDGATMSGQFTQGGAAFPFTLKLGENRAAKAAAALQGLDAIVEAALADWKTPGLALAVVADDKVVLAKGYGLRDTTKKLPVTPRTLFAIGSASKAFTTFTMGLLVDEGKLDWDTPVATYLPGFRLHDEHATAHLTPRDMVSHRSGLPRHDLLWYNNDAFSRAELVRRLRFLEPNEDLRAKWQYNNLMFLTAGCLIEQLTGGTWEQAVRSRVLDPLGMTRTNFSVTDSQRDDDHAQPYQEDDDQLREVAFRPVVAMAPAGAINSSAEEMARWLLVQLGGGRIDGRSLIAAGTLREMHTPQMVIGGMPAEDYVSAESYGLGWFIDTWRGHYRVHHGGNIDGFSALVTLFPRDGVGVVALVNKSGSGLPGLVTATVADRVLGLEPRGWIAEAAGKRDKAKPWLKEGEKNKALFRVKDTHPSRSLADYAAEYEHPGYGVLEIRAVDQGLTLIFNGMTMPLEHWHYDVFNVAKSREEVIPEDLRVSFVTDERGRVARVSIPLEPFVAPIVFERRPPKRLHDPKFLALLAGAYSFPNQTLTIALQGEGLVLRQQDGSTFELTPSGEDEFTLKGLNGYSMKFTVPGGGGPATEMLAIQPDGVFKGPRAAGK